LIIPSKQLLTVAQFNMMDNKVLVVDDNEFILSLISYILDNNGYQVEVSNCAEGLFDHIDKYHPNLIILDATLPDGDGRDLCRQIKETESTHNIPVVMCSGRDDIAESMEQQGPPDGILPKPFDINQLMNMVSSKLPLAA
jgi:DNA-binding response OmpR family regulator